MSPLIFGKVFSMKKRILWSALAALVVVCAVCVLLYTAKPNAEISAEMAAFIETQILEHYGAKSAAEAFCCTDFKVLGAKQKKNQTTVYLWVLYETYSSRSGQITEESGNYVPAVLTIDACEEAYTLTAYREPRDGSLYSGDIRRMFPRALYGDAMDSQKFIAEQKKNCMKKAEAYFAAQASRLQRLKENFPMYFGLDCSSGLNVYIWQMAPESYSCALLPAGAEEPAQETLWSLCQSAVSLEDAREIVASYFPEISSRQVHICPISMPHSSYYYTINDAYRAETESLFWSDFPKRDN